MKKPSGIDLSRARNAHGEGSNREKVFNIWLDALTGNLLVKLDTNDLKCRKIAIVLLGILLMENSPAAQPVQGWEYQYQHYGTGTKSESISGKLLFQGHELPKEFEYVITPIGEFTFSNDMGFSGAALHWAPFCGGFAITAKDVSSLLSGANPNFRKYIAGSQAGEPSSTAYIAGTYEKPPKEAGANWFYVVKQGLWVNPAKMHETLKTMMKQGKAQ